MPAPNTYPSREASLAVWRSLFVLLASIIVTGSAAWLTFGVQAASDADVAKAIAAHEAHPHVGGVSRHEWELHREALAEMKADIREIRDGLRQTAKDDSTR